MAHVTQDIIDQNIAASKALGAAVLQTNQDVLLKSRELIASAALNSVQQFRDGFHEQTLAALRKTLEFDQAPFMAAIQTCGALV